MDLLIWGILCTAPFLFASLVRKAAKDIFPWLECCIFTVETIVIGVLLACIL